MIRKENMKKKKKVVEARDVKALRRLALNLVSVPEKKIDDAICDIIDIGGFSVAALLEKLPELPADTRHRVVRKLEDFFYFHPERGIRLFARIKKAIAAADPVCKPILVAILADISEKIDDNDLEISRMGDDALGVLYSDSDLLRKSKAIEILVKASSYAGIPRIIELMLDSTKSLDSYQNYHFMETSIMALKRLGGESLLRLLINPQSDTAMKQLRIEWRTMDSKLLAETLSMLQRLDADFAQVMLKVIDLSDFNLPFIAMVNEGVAHSDKWVRQAAVASMQKASEALSPEILSRMLNDSAAEVRLMAATSLGGFSKEQTGEILEELASRQGESLEIRLNALYALYSQKNIEALKNLAIQPDNFKTAINAQGLASLLMPHEDGIKTMLSAYCASRSEFAAEAGHYLMELLEPEDIKFLIESHASAGSETQRERILEVIACFIDKKNGPRLDVALGKLSDAERKALKLLSPNLVSK